MEEVVLAVADLAAVVAVVLAVVAVVETATDSRVADLLTPTNSRRESLGKDQLPVREAPERSGQEAKTGRKAAAQARSKDAGGT